MFSSCGRPSDPTIERYLCAQAAFTTRIPRNGALSSLSRTVYSKSLKLGREIVIFIKCGNVGSCSRKHAALVSVKYDHSPGLGFGLDCIYVALGWFNSSCRQVDRQAARHLHTAQARRAMFTEIIVGKNA